MPLCLTPKTWFFVLLRDLLPSLFGRRLALFACLAPIYCVAVDPFSLLFKLVDFFRFCGVLTHLHHHFLGSWFPTYLALQGENWFGNLPTTSSTSSLLLKILNMCKSQNLLSSCAVLVLPLTRTTPLLKWEGKHMNICTTSL